jgi:5-methylcytosine-specific restriction endonuclease McrA
MSSRDDYQHLYKTRAWQDLRMRQLERWPDCWRCAKRGKRTPATEVHHIKPHRGDTELFFDAYNLQSLCGPCHCGPVQQQERRGYSTDRGRKIPRALDCEPLAKPNAAYGRPRSKTQGRKCRENLGLRLI